jgi:hypothetical protein
MSKNIAHRVGPLFLFALLPSCSQLAGPTDEQVSRDVTSFLQEKCEPLGAKTGLRPLTVTAVRVERRVIGEELAEVVAVAEGRLAADSVSRGDVFSDYCPAGPKAGRKLQLNYVMKGGSWHFDGTAQDTRGARAPLATASSQNTGR